MRHGCSRCRARSSPRLARCARDCTGAGAGCSGMSAAPRLFTTALLSRKYLAPRASSWTAVQQLVAGEPCEIAEVTMIITTRTAAARAPGGGGQQRLQLHRRSDGQQGGRTKHSPSLPSSLAGTVRWRERSRPTSCPHRHGLVGLVFAGGEGNHLQAGMQSTSCRRRPEGGRHFG